MPIQGNAQGFAHRGNPAVSTTTLGNRLVNPSGTSPWANNLAVKRFEISFTDSGFVELQIGRAALSAAPSPNDNSGTFFRGASPLAGATYSEWETGYSPASLTDCVGQYFLGAGSYGWDFPEPIECIYRTDSGHQLAFCYLIKRTDGVVTSLNYHVNVRYEEY